MPELPEVETIVRDLSPALVGHAIEEVDILAERSVERPSPLEFRRRLIGQRIQAVRRRAKYILVRVASGDWLVVHLGMTGSLVLNGQMGNGQVGNGQVGNGQVGNEKHLRCRFRLDDGRWLLFRDMRRFGRLQVLSDDEVRALEKRLGPEPLDSGFAVQGFRERLSTRRAPVKAVLLDQGLLAGLGNIYADEALFLAGVNPRRLASTLTEAEVEGLYGAIRQVLQEAIRARGTTFSDYRDGYGRAGGHRVALKVYRRTSLPCPCCGAAIQRIVVGGRSTHFCPRCQPERL